MQSHLLTLSLALWLSSPAAAAEPFWPPRQLLPHELQQPVLQPTPRPYRTALPVVQHIAPPRSVILPAQYLAPQNSQPSDQQQQQQQFAPGQTIFFYGSSPTRPQPTPTPQFGPTQQSGTGQPNDELSGPQQPGIAQAPNADIDAMSGDPKSAASVIPGQTPTDRRQEEPAPRLRQGEMLPSPSRQSQQQLDPRVSDYFQRLRGPNISNHNQNQQGHSFYGQNHYQQTRVAESSALQTRFNISSPNNSTHNMSRAGFSQSNYSMHNMQTRSRTAQP